MRKAAAARKAVGFLIYPGVQALDVAGPMDAFAAATVDDGKGGQRPGYEILPLGLSIKPVRAECGLVFKPQFTLASAPQLDTLIIPGGRGMREGNTAAKLAPLLRARAARTRRVASVCTGVFGVALADLVGKRRVTTHWKYVTELKKRFPDLPSILTRSS